MKDWISNNIVSIISIIVGLFTAGTITLFIIIKKKYDKHKQKNQLKTGQNANGINIHQNQTNNITIGDINNGKH